MTRSSEQVLRQKAPWEKAMRSPVGGNRIPTVAEVPFPVVAFALLWNVIGHETANGKYGKRSG